MKAKCGTQGDGFTHPVHILTKGEELPAGDIVYAIASDGAYLAQKGRVFSAVTRVATVPGLGELKEIFTFNLPRMPFHLLDKAVAFFRAVDRKRGGAESSLNIYHSTATETDRGYLLLPPQQRVGGAHVNYRGMLAPKGHIYVGDVHRHPGAPFHPGFSGTDDREQDGLHIVVGLDGPSVTFTFSFTVQGKRIPLEDTDVIEPPPIGSVPAAWMASVRRTPRPRRAQSMKTGLAAALGDLGGRAEE